MTPCDVYDATPCDWRTAAEVAHLCQLCGWPTGFDCDDSEDGAESDVAAVAEHLGRLVAWGMAERDGDGFRYRARPAARPAGLFDVWRYRGHPMPPRAHPDPEVRASWVRHWAFVFGLSRVCLYDAAAGEWRRAPSVATCETATCAETPRPPRRWEFCHRRGYRLTVEQHAARGCREWCAAESAASRSARSA